MLGLAVEPSLVTRRPVIFEKASLRLKYVMDVITIGVVRLPLWQYPRVGGEVSVSWPWGSEKADKKSTKFS